MLPEISRRCLVCGASVRAEARFCPQCGGNLMAREREEGAQRSGSDSPPTREFKSAGTTPQTNGARAADAGQAPAPPPTREHAALRDEREHRAGRDEREPRTPANERGTVPASRETGATVREQGEAQSPRARREVPPTRDRAGLDAAGAEEALDEEAAEEEGAGESRRVRAAARVREVRESLKPRVEKMREDALVALEEAPDDSGLRFVLIAAGLFGLFVLFLVLSIAVLD
jgi:hypothetical protein